MTWIKFRDRTTDERFAVINTHFDHVSAKARRKSAAIVRDVANRLLTNHDVPVIVLGDFNAKENTSTTWKIVNQGPLMGYWNAGGEHLTDRWDTYSGWAAPQLTGRRIDWILRTGGVAVHAVAINPTPYLDDLASDHLPVHALLELR